jgi:hypothetical protein
MKPTRNALLSCLAAVFLPAAAQAQTQLVDCACLAQMHELQTVACQDVIPDVCALLQSYSCLTAGVLPQCSQSPAPGGSVGPGTHPITVTFSAPSLGLTQTCQLNFVVTAPAGGCGTGACLSPPTGMVGWWPLDEACGATVYVDLSGSSNPAFVQSGLAVCSPGSPNAVPGKVAGAGYFYGPTVRGRAPNAPSLNFGNNSFSADCWVNPVPFAGGRQPIVDKLQKTSPTTGFGYALSVLNGNLELRLGDGTLYTHTGPAVVPNTWNFVAVAVDRTANTVTFYANGVTSAPQTLAPAGSFNSPVDLFIGGSHAVNDPYGELALDEVELFNRVLTAAEMTALWQADSNGKCKTNQPCQIGVSCPTNIIVHTCGTNAVVTYPAPTLTGPCASNAIVVFTPPSGSTFPAGTTTVTCSVYDANGFPAGKCTFTVTVVPFSSGVYDFLPVTIPGTGGKFTSPNGNGFITVQTAGGPFLGLNNTVYSSQFPNLFAPSGTVQGYLAQADNNAFYTVTFNLSNYALSPSTVFGIWNITEETDLYKVEVFDCANTLIAPPFPPYFNFMGWDDDALSGNIGWYHMTLNPSTGFLSTAPFLASGIDCDAAFWNNLPPNACKIVVTGRLGPADGVVFYFAEPKPCCEITCPSNITVTTCGNGAVVNYPAPVLAGPCLTNATVVCTPPSGSTFPLGTNTVTCTAIGPSGPQASCSFTVTVLPGALPVITCPTNIVAKAYPWCTTNGTTVAYPLPQVTNGTLVSCTPPSGSFFPYGITTVTCLAVNACGTNSCTFTVTVMSDMLIPPCAPPPPNMVMWLKFDETSGATAYNGASGNNGLLANSPGHNLGQFVVNSLCFNGVNQYVQVKPYAAMQFGTNDFTVDAWVKPATFANTVRVIVDHREENGPVVRGYSLFLGAGNTVGFQIADGTFINYAFTSIVPADGQWHFVAVSVKRNDPLGIKLYVDGVADPNPRDPTIHPGSVTAGPCYPFRVASRSSSVSGLFPGCVDEVELFRRALAPSELQAIYDARCKGKCRISCQAGGSTYMLPCWLGHSISNLMVINNPLPYPQTFTWSLQPLPVGPGCTKPGPTFSPSSGTITIPAYNPGVIGTSVTMPPGFYYGDCTCFRLTITTADGQQQAICDGTYCMPKWFGGVAAPTTPLAVATNLGAGSVTFALQGSGSTSATLSNILAVLRSPENAVVSITPLPPVTVPPAGGEPVQVPASFAFPDYDPGRVYSLTLEAVVDGSGEYTGLCSVPAINVVPASPEEGELSVQRGAGGSIIIKWPDPCGTIVVNPNLGNPAGWTPGPVQTSPWVFVPDPAAPPTFIRLQK